MVHQSGVGEFNFNPNKSRYPWRVHWPNLGQLKPASVH
ncbi:hypothetical protein D082_20900 [Synechocystis sp. PCC 6714]|nr:hypothetical protein D082_20900 [Synechocystis sp. PCC 6714]